MMPAVKTNPGLLSELLQGIAEVAGSDNREIAEINIDSRQVGSNDLFIALPGTENHGLSYLPGVVKSGAACVLFDNDVAEKFQSLLKEFSKKIVQIKVNDINHVAGVVIDRFYNSPSHKMQVVGITGTDGKTSVSRFLAQVMNDDMKSAVIGTTGNGLWGDIKDSTHTTPDVLSLHKLLSQFNKQNAELVSMEVSSHGIKQQRIAGVEIETAVLTNVSRDHIDYHGSVENYRQVKKQLFSQASVKNIVLNLDDATGVELLQQLKAEKNVWGYSLNASCHDLENCVYAESVSVESSGFSVAVVTPAGKTDVYVPLLGRFNIANVLSVLCVLLINKIGLKESIAKIEKLKTAPGRMELFSGNEKASVVVDYAHTPKALEMALLAVSEHCVGKLWCVFGCGGDRDKGKRALMGTVAERLADRVIVTNDNPRTESPADIIGDILSGFNSQKNVDVMSDRAEAIRYACENAAVTDVVLVAGKGHEEYQIIADTKIPFSDRKEVIKNLGGLH